MNPVTEKLKRRLFVIAGIIAMTFGGIGIFMPVLPTTPFLLLAAFCYLRGSPKLYDSLLRNRIVGAYLRNYLEGRGMSLKMKIWTLSLLWITVICTALFLTDNLIVRIILALVLVGVTTHILLVKTMKQ